MTKPTAGVSSVDTKTGPFTTANGVESTAGNVIQLPAARRTLPTTQVFLTGSGTYTTPANCLWIRVRMWGDGGGGSNSVNAGSNGAGTTFGTLTAGGGGGCATTPGAVGAGGIPTGGDINITGGRGGNVGTSDAGRNSAGMGGAAFGGMPTAPALADSSGFSGISNSGAGGSGGSYTAGNGSPGGGGGGGGYCEKIIGTPAATYSYGVGAGGAGGAASGSANSAGPGGSGMIIVEEHYGS